MNTESDGVDATIVFLDLVRYTSLTDIHGDAAGANAATDLVGVTKDALGPGVEVVKALGDGVLLRADTPAIGLATASRIVEGVHELGRGLDLTGGVDHGSVIIRDDDVFGATVNLAARAAALTTPGSLAVTRPVALAAASAGLAAEPLGELDVNGFSAPVELFRIDACEHDGHWITDPVCGMRLDSDHVTEWEETGHGRTGFCSADCAARYRASPERFPMDDRP